MVERYSDDIQEWLVEMYSSYGKYLHRTLPTFIQDPFFLLYDTEAEFRALSYDVYPKIIKRYKFLNGQAEMIYRFLKDEHHSRSLVSEEYGLPFITEGINDWMEKTYHKHGVNMYSFCSEYMVDFLDNPDKWPKGHRKRSQYYNEFNKPDSSIKVPQTLLYEYDFMQKNNLFGLDMLYRKMPKKSFVKGKKQEIEGILMYCYCCEYCSEDQYWREYSEKLL